MFASHGLTNSRNTMCDNIFLWCGRLLLPFNFWVCMKFWEFPMNSWEKWIVDVSGINFVCRYIYFGKYFNIISHICNWRRRLSIIHYTQYNLIISDFISINFKLQSILNDDKSSIKSLIVKFETKKYFTIWII